MLALGRFPPESLMILFMDDDITRVLRFHIWAARHRPDEIVVTARDGDLAIEALGKMAFDVWHLDHDMGPNAYARYHDPKVPKDPNELDGQDVVTWALRNLPRENLPQNVILHSFNEPRARDMQKALKAAGIRAEYLAFEKHFVEA
jgi:CheY-like chemotaxis protein